MFKPQTLSANGADSTQSPLSEPAPRVPAQRGSLIGPDLRLEGNISGGAEVQIDGQITGDVRVERVNIGEGGQVDGAVFADAVEVRGRVAGSITAKLVRLAAQAHVEGDITHEQLAIETGAFFQGRSLRLQRPAAQPAKFAESPPPTPVLRPPEGAESARISPIA
jgi:cytoskeletal protein CcmA (bactofilin family)